MAPPTAPAPAHSQPRAPFRRMFAGTLAATFACVLVLSGVLRRAGVAAERAYHWSAGAWFALLPVFICSFARAPLRRGDTSAAPPGPRPSGAA